MNITNAIALFARNRERRNCTTGAIKTYTSQLGLLAQFLADKSIKHVTTDDLGNYIERIKAEGQSAVTVRQRAKTFRTFFRWLKETQVIEDDPSRNLHIPKRPHRLPKTLSREQIKSLISAPLSTRDRALIFLMLDSGMRRGEIAQLEIEDLDLQRGIAHVRHGKGDKERYVLFAEHTIEAVKTWLDERTTSSKIKNVFVNRYGKPLRVGGIYKCVKKAAKLAGINARPHVLRHSFATDYIDRGGSITDLQMLMGHTDINTTMIYVNVAIERVREKHKQLSLLDNLLG